MPTAHCASALGKGFEPEIPENEIQGRVARGIPRLDGQFAAAVVQPEPVRPHAVRAETQRIAGGDVPVFIIEHQSVLQQAQQVIVLAHLHFCGQSVLFAVIFVLDPKAEIQLVRADRSAENGVDELYVVQLDFACRGVVVQRAVHADYAHADLLYPFSFVQNRGGQQFGGNALVPAVENAVQCDIAQLFQFWEKIPNGSGVFQRRAELEMLRGIGPGIRCRAVRIVVRPDDIPDGRPEFGQRVVADHVGVQKFGLQEHRMPVFGRHGPEGNVVQGKSVRIVGNG